MTTIVLHYQSPAGDPFKASRPHFVEVGSDLRTEVHGGEAGHIDAFLGLCPTETPDVEDWHVVTPLKIIENGDDFPGWYAQFAADGGMFGYNVPIERVDVIK